MSKDEKSIRDQIAKELERQTAKTAPNVHYHIQSEVGYKMVEGMIIKMSAIEGFSISGCIPQVDDQI